MTKEDRINEFLAEYQKLCEKYKVNIGTCQCGAVFVEPFDSTEEELGLSHYVKETETHTKKSEWDKLNEVFDAVLQNSLEKLPTAPEQDHTDRDEYYDSCRG